MIIDKPLKLDNIQLMSMADTNISEQYISWMNNADITKYTEARHREYSYQDLVSFVQTCNKEKSSLLLGIFYDDVHIGNIKADFNREYQVAGVGLIIGDNSQHGKGIGTQAIGLMCEYLFHVLGIFKINAGIYASNTSSIKAFKRAGFHLEYVKQKHIINISNEREDVLMMVKYAS